MFCFFYYICLKFHKNSKRIIHTITSVLPPPQGHPSPRQATPRCPAHPRPPPLSTASRARPLCSTILISLLTNRARLSAQLPHLLPPQVHSSYSVLKCCFKSEVDLQQNWEAVSEPPTQNIKMKNKLYSRTDDEQYPSDFLVLSFSLPLLWNLFLCLFNPLELSYRTPCIPSLLLFFLPASFSCTPKLWRVVSQQDSC